MSVQVGAAGGQSALVLQLHVARSMLQTLPPEALAQSALVEQTQDPLLQRAPKGLLAQSEAFWHSTHSFSVVSQSFLVELAAQSALLAHSTHFPLSHLGRPERTWQSASAVQGFWHTVVVEEEL